MFPIPTSPATESSASSRWYRRGIAAATALTLLGSLHAADPVPAGERLMANFALPGAPQPQTAGDESPQYPVQTWTLPAVTVDAESRSELREEEPIGSYGQPRWTAHRRFPTSRVYVRPEGEMDVEVWNRTKVPKKGKTEWIHTVEFEIGLPHRFQADIYGITRQKEGEDRYYDLALELRYALADWGELPGNPTLYAEYIFKDDSADVFEGKLLFGGELAPRWHWATNLVWEQELADAEERVFELTNGISYTVIDEKLSIGVEAKSEIVDEKGDRGNWSEDIRIGPSLQWRPTQRFHVDVAPLFGVTDDSKKADIYLVAGFEF